MHIRYLDLIAYGNFEDRRIGFRPGAAIHLIYGPNEAGKSTALQAIGDLLYDFPQRYTGKARLRPVDFRFRLPELRLGGQLQRKDGQSIAFVRRKANKAALSDPETGDVLPEDALDAFLGGLNRERFIREHGLDAETLRQGGAVLSGETDADLGGSLLAAASGLVGLRRLQTKLDSEADDIFTPRSRKSRFATARSERDAAREQERDTESVLSAKEWRDNETAIRDNAAAQDEIRQKLALLDQRHRALSRQIQLRPALWHLDEARQNLTEFDDLSDLSQSFAERIENALSEKEEAARTLVGVEAHHKRLGEQLDRYTPDEALVAAMPAVKELAESLGAFREWQTDIPKLKERLTAQKAEEMRWWSELDPGGEAQSGALPSIAERTHLNQQALRLQNLLATRQNRSEEMVDLAERMNGEGEGDGDKDRPDLHRCLQLTSSLASVLDPLAAAFQQREEGRRSAMEADAEALRLDPPVAELSAKIELAWPSDDEVEKAIARHTALATERSRLESLLAEMSEAMKHHDQATENDGSAGELPDRADLQRARQSRDAGLSEFREGKGNWPETLDKVGVADRIADRLIDDAERIASRQRDRVERAKLDRQYAETARKMDASHETMATWRNEWSALFSLLSDKPPLPGRAANWLGRLRSLRDVSAAALVRQDDAGATITRAEEHRGALLELAAALEVANASALSSDVLWRAVTVQIDELKQVDQARQTARAVLAEHRKSYRHAESEYQRLSGEIETLSSKLKTALKGFSLPDDMSPETVFAILQGLNNLSEIRAKAAETERRLIGIETKSDTFRREARELIGRLMPSAIDDPLGTAVGRLRDRCEEATSLAKRAAELRSERGEASETLTEAQARVRLVDKVLGECAALLPDDSDLTLVANRLRQRERAAETLVEEQQRFADLADGLSENEVRQSVHETDEISTRDELMRIEDEKSIAEGERERHRLEAGRLAERRDALSKRRGSELAAFHRQAAEERMESAAREWGRLRAASILLDAAMERYAKSVPNTTLDQAGRLFQTLTAGAFSGLAEDLDGDGKPILLVQRADGTKMPVGDTLSEGTRDQLYLALRLAWLKERSERADLPPFIGDDLFASFDDARTQAGLKAMADVSSAIQPILFTHHKAVVEAAKETLGDGLDLIEL
ncbi:YhaN family protein [Notoacmeibacter sp. MSK16QG-6]|uniref:ATP-binding protein n=1 Tax=Notoacmeibacter sp. MSK16QG-6 TaxID=2957982 RepID=UPI00209C9A4B|nr:YhaN family protein [Notoacmeibacter sp. MSK16QG-6]MCP1198538.1 AAA family ATPase [Notoacmeibacter sp. MSK16QG-6]